MTTTLLHITTVPMSLTFLRGQLQFMKARGLKIHVISSPGLDLELFGANEGVGFSAVGMQRRITPLRDLHALSEILRHMRSVRPVIVHAHTPKGGLLGMIAAALYRAPVRIYHMRGLPLVGATGLRRRLLWATEWLSCHLAHQVLCVSHSVKNEAIDSGICPPWKIKVLRSGSGNGVDTRRFNPDVAGSAVRIQTREQFGIPRDALVIGFVGRLVRDKGIRELADAWRELREAHPHLHLMLVGPLEPHDPVPADTLEMLRCDHRVHLVGMDWDTPRLYAAMDVVALPTYREGFPNVPLEAAAMHLPVVATRISGCIDAIVDGKTGLLVPPRDAAALHAALDLYVVNDALRAAHGDAARERIVNEFGQAAIWTALYAEYILLLETRCPRAVHTLSRERIA